MSKISPEVFFSKLHAAPHAARGFFESISTHFKRKNDICVHHTGTNNGDLRLAIRGEVLEQKRIRNFATMYWQSRNRMVFARTFLTPDELSVFGFDNGTAPRSASEPLNSDIQLTEAQWRYGVADFIKALETAKMILAASIIRNHRVT